MSNAPKTGIIGGSGMLGRAIAHALLDRMVLPASDLWISNRSGSKAGFEQFPDVHVTTDNAQLCAACEVLILSVPPALAPGIGIHAPGKLVISVMAGMTIKELQALTGSDRVVRAMSSPAAQLGLAYSPWVASPAIDATDRDRVTNIFSACGATDKIADENHLDHFTAMTGPVPGFVAFYADCMIDYAVKAGIPPAIADRAIRQLFFSAGAMLAHSEASPADHVQQMIDYAGTTAAGLAAMRNSSISGAIAEGLDAAVEKARNIR
ncbi:MAG: NAD(P)-binding domain-containing protein [Hoeflea sp.]|uniref:pyrroline-5-carboxylate reductase family protein n=1 Tax=Hoeflea sp. TaxID=1940281 RepID=UPI001E19BBF9|nr:pyrroline-5-carboxylate reductase dimerization domain-containing protein [Hoeflea sp.]MBU4528331.1 NAD(P)-binding domain-containing protein [Alphaproteobacteria bacterium]MBU4543000.1 NAD(P)-binding domain-containing protein [Alphaproteobacteria bacterium]MBU4551691.1 NAD(P)-binding domain-containing protein [Alphaproteobacteria bacterium]MBV1723586.1 NAD(P)-binding domain-containing protein [Hoeflea sp.]MBV1761902.1 NAD(P)-binding domain-containing protein [Hoeflea sp.]